MSLMWPQVDPSIVATFSAGLEPGRAATSSRHSTICHTESPATWRSFAAIKSANDFKDHTGVRPSQTGDLEEVAPGGEIKHGTLADLTYTNKVDTYAKMLAITRQDIINDDLGALSDVPMKLGAGAMKKLNDIFWTEFLGLVGASFFASGNSNINTLGG